MKGDRKSGTFSGVFTPTIPTILSAIMYLRTVFFVKNSSYFMGDLLKLEEEVE